MYFNHTNGTAFTFLKIVGKITMVTSKTRYCVQQKYFNGGLPHN